MARFIFFYSTQCQFFLTEPNDFLEHNQTAIHSLLWILILHYQLNYTPKTGVTVETAVFLLKRSFLTWINSVVTGLTITNLSTDWRDGRALTALCEYCKPGAFVNGIGSKNKDAVSKIKNVMDLAEEDFGIPPVIDAQDFAAEKPDERSVMMYLSYFVGTASGPGPGQGVLLKWITEQIPDQRVANLTSDWQDGRVLGALTNAVSGGKFTTFEEMSPENDLQNVEQSMNAAEKMLKVRRIIKVNEFADTQLNRILRLSYLSQFYHAMVSDNAPSLIPPAPDKVEVSQVHVPESVGEGKHVCVQLDCSDAGHGTPKAEVVGRKVGSVVYKIERFGTDKYIVKFVPPEVDVYKFSIFYGDGDNHVTGSPFAVNLHPPDPEGVKHIDTANPNEDVKHVSMTFNTKEAGRGKLKAKATGEIVGSVPIKINIESDGTYVITFIPPTADVYMVDVLWGKFSAHAIGKVCGSIPLDIDGDIRECKVSFKPPSPDVYTVDVNWEGKPVPGSPFKINHQPPPQPEKVVWTEIYYTTPGMDAILIVDLSNAGTGKLTAECVGKICGKVDVEVKKVEGRTFQLTFNPPKEDLYTLSIKFHDIHIERSPFEIDMRSKRVIEYDITTDHKSNELVENTIHKDELTMLVGQLLIVNVRVQDAHQQEGNLDVFVNGSATDKVKIKQLGGGIFKVEFKPDKPEHYKIDVQYNGKQKALVIIHCIRRPTLIATTSVFKQGDPVCYKIDLEGLEYSKVSAKCTSKDNEKLKVEISRDTTDTKKCMYNIFFTPPKPSRYTLSVSYDNHEIINIIIDIHKSTKLITTRVEVGDLDEHFHLHQSKVIKHKHRVKTAKQTRDIITTEVIKDKPRDETAKRTWDIITTEVIKDKDSDETAKRTRDIITTEVIKDKDSDETAKRTRDSITTEEVIKGKDRDETAKRTRDIIATEEVIKDKHRDETAERTRDVEEVIKGKDRDETAKPNHDIITTEVVKDKDSDETAKRTRVIEEVIKDKDSDETGKRTHDIEEVIKGKHRDETAKRTRDVEEVIQDKPRDETATRTWDIIATEEVIKDKHRDETAKPNHDIIATEEVIKDKDSDETATRTCDIIATEEVIKVKDSDETAKPNHDIITTEVVKDKDSGETAKRTRVIEEVIKDKDSDETGKRTHDIEEVIKGKHRDETAKRTRDVEEVIQDKPRDETATRTWDIIATEEVIKDKHRDETAKRTRDVEEVIKGKHRDETAKRTRDVEEVIKGKHRDETAKPNHDIIATEEVIKDKDSDETATRTCDIIATEEVIKVKDSDETAKRTCVKFSLLPEKGETSIVSAMVLKVVCAKNPNQVSFSQLPSKEGYLEFVPTQGQEYIVDIQCRVKF